MAAPPTYVLGCTRIEYVETQWYYFHAILVCTNMVWIYEKTIIAWTLALIAVVDASLDCGDPGTPMNGERILPSTTIGSTVEYSCVVGFALQGNSSRICQANRLWSGTLPTCVGKWSKIILWLNEDSLPHSMQYNMYSPTISMFDCHEKWSYECNGTDKVLYICFNCIVKCNTTTLSLLAINSIQLWCALCWCGQRMGLYLLLVRLWVPGQPTSVTMDLLVWGCCKEPAQGMETGEERSPLVSVSSWVILSSTLFVNNNFHCDTAFIASCGVLIYRS